MRLQGDKLEKSLCDDALWKIELSCLEQAPSKVVGFSNLWPRVHEDFP